MTNQAAIRREAWRRGIIGPLLLDSNQLGMSEWIDQTFKKERLAVINKSRQLGGSFLVLLKCCELAMQMPGAQIKYAAQTQKQVRKILRPHLRAIFATCPEEWRPRYHSADAEYRFPNGSSITIAGCDRENAETLRGQHAHLAVVDEAGAIADLKYVVDDILMPQTLNTRGRILVISSPAKRPAHPFKTMCDEADERGALLERDIYTNPRLTKEEIEELCRAAGGPLSTTWKREYLCQHVTDEESAVLPEATKEQLASFTLVLVTETDLSYRPSHFDTYITIDPGWSPDFTGVLWSIWDFIGGRVVIEKDFVMKRMNTGALHQVLRDGADELWGKGHKPFMAVSDIDHRLIADLATYGWDFVPYMRDNQDEAINSLRLSISGQRVPFWTHPRCKTTRRQFQNVVWNKARTKFDRTALDGHFDLVPAAYMLRRHLLTTHNPIPREVRFPHGNGLVIDRDKPLTKTEQVFSRLFKR